MSYYDRSVGTHLDGSPIFKTEIDERNENEVSAAIAAAWRCNVRSFGRLSPIDWYAERDGRLVGVLELKSRSHPSSKHPTVFLNVRKWLTLAMASMGLGVPAIFVVRFEDQTLWVPLSKVDASSVRMGGCSRIVKSRSDVEPVIEIPVKDMTLLR
jgi:hypothetical protein